VLLYVDDVVIATGNMITVNKFNNYSMKKFRMTDQTEKQERKLASAS